MPRYTEGYSVLFPIKRAGLALVALGSLLLIPFAFPKDESSFALHNGDRVVFYGDSITDQRLYTMVTELYAVTRYPKLEASFIHSGWGGDRVTGGGGGPIDLRLQRDVFAYKPTVMTVMLGMNDGHYTEHVPADDQQYYDGFKHIIDSVQKTVPDIRITLIEPSPFDDVTRPFTLQPSGYNSVLLNYSDWLARYGAEHHLTVADFNRPVVEMLEAAKTTDAAVAEKILPDRVHPSLSGHLIMAEQLIKAWHGRPLVSSVHIDAGAGKVAETAFTKVSDFHDGNPFVWTSLDESLPFPLADMLAGDRDHTLALAVKSSDFIQAVDRQMVQITGLKQGSYRLTVDGELVGQWTAKELADGVNLGALETPMSKQAMEVRDLTVRHLDIHQFRWRTLQVPLSNSGLAHLDETMTNLDGIEADVIKKQHAAAQPRPHRFELIPTT